MAIVTVLNASTLANPAGGREGYRRNEIDVGAHHELASGALVFDYVTARYRHHLEWIGITTAQRNTIRTGYDGAKAAAVAFTAPDGGAYTVLAVPNSYSEEFITFDDGATNYWYITLELEDSS